ncbi:MAG: isoprenylcysteine carboxylmethyltransferase family protein [Marinicella sp.]|nr:isoprenylcysteine carboxylmethyltransferase family protein [Xanthomonadales bacterium]
MKKITIFIYGVISYILSMAVLVYGIGFIGNIYVENSLDAMPSIPFSQALMINIGLLSLFAVQHSGMARSGFKKWLTQFIPASAERATYNIFSSVVMIILFYFWQPMGGFVWSTDNEVIKNLALVTYMFGWGVIVLSTFLIDHFHLFGLKQVWNELKSTTMNTSKFMMPSLYKRVRHPLYVGWLIVVWVSPVMTSAHLVFALMCTAYILVGILFEEKDLEKEFGEQYRAYKAQVPMIIPSLKAKEIEVDQLVVNKQGATS